MKYTQLTVLLILSIGAALPAAAQVQPYQPDPWRPIPGQPYQPPSPLTYPVPTLRQPTTHCVAIPNSVGGVVLRCTTY